MMDSRILYLGCVVFSFLSTGCGGYVGAARSQPQSTANFQNLIEHVLSRDSKLHEDWRSSLKIDMTVIDPKESLRSVYFLNETLGWIGGSHGLYATTDGGNNWRRTAFDLPVDAAVIKVYFTDPNVGWIVAQKKPVNWWDYQQNHFWLLITDDGGHTWRKQLEGEDSEAFSIRFYNNQEGWLVGWKYLGLEPLRTRNFIFHTLDQGKHWLDISENLNQILIRYNGYIRNAFTEIVPDRPLTANILMPEGRIYRTENAGQTWKPVSGVIDNVNYIGCDRMGATAEGHLWVGGGKDSWDLPKGLIAVKEGDVWTKYVLPGVDFADVLPLTREQVIAAGFLVRNQSNDSDKPLGVVCYSGDGGLNWSILYSNSNAQQVNAIASTPDNNIWVVGEAGLVLHMNAAEALAKVKR